MVIYLQSIHLQNETKIEYVAHKMAKLFEFFTMYVLFPQS